MKIDQNKIGKYIFTKDEKDQTFRIPDYQRPYIWDASRVEDFWIDLTDDQSTSLQFIGSFIFSNHGNVQDVVDGQQRMLTMYILLAVLRDFIRDFDGNLTLSDSIQQRIANTNDSGLVVDYTLTCWDDTDKFFKDYILSGKSSSKELKKFSVKKNENQNIYNIKNNYKYIYELLAEYVGDGDVSKKVDEVLQRLINLEFVYIEVDSDEDAYAAFEIVNARGEALGNMDLLKNLFYKNAAAADDKEWAINQWKIMADNTEGLPKIDQEVFMRHLWLSLKGGRYFITNKKLFKSIKSLMISTDDNAENYKSLLKKIVINSEIYSHLYDPDNYEWVRTHKYNKEISNHLRKIGVFNIIQQNILFLSLIRNSEKIPDKTIRNMFRLVERFHFSYSAIGKGPTNRVEKLYAKYAEEIEISSTDKMDDLYNDFRNDLRIVLNAHIKKESFIEKFHELQYKKKDIVRYIFSVLEDHIYGTGEKQIDFLNANIEHVESQTSGENKFSDEALHNIGNLVIISIKCNSKVGNKPISKKVDIYRESECSELRIVKKLVQRLDNNNAKWTESDVFDRANELGGVIYDEYIMSNDGFGN